MGPNAGNSYYRVFFAFDLDVALPIELEFYCILTFLRLLAMGREQFSDELVDDRFSAPLHRASVERRHRGRCHGEVDHQAHIRPHANHTVPHVTNAEPDLRRIFRE